MPSFAMEFTVWKSNLVNQKIFHKTAEEILETISLTITKSFPRTLEEIKLTASLRRK